MWRSGLMGRLEAVTAVKPVRIARDELKSAKALKIRMRHHGLDEPFAKAKARCVSST